MQSNLYLAEVEQCLWDLLAFLDLKSIHKSQAFSSQGGSVWPHNQEYRPSPNPGKQ